MVIFARQLGLHPIPEAFARQSFVEGEVLFVEFIESGARKGERPLSRSEGMTIAVSNAPTRWVSLSDDLHSHLQY